MSQSQINLYAKVLPGGKLNFTNKEALTGWLKTLPEGEEIVVKFNLQKSYKTFRQVRLLYSCLREISDHTGHDVEELKLILKLKAGLCFSHQIENEDITVCKSISDFTKKELCNFIEFVDRWATKTLDLPLLTNEDLNFLKT